MPLVEALPSLTFLGHSTVLIELGGLRILTDPVLFDRVGLLRRVVNPLDPGLYARIDVALLSHLHRDHFDLASLRLLGQGVRLLVPAGASCPPAGPWSWARCHSPRLTLRTAASDRRSDPEQRRSAT